MARTITELTAASTPLAGTELAWIEQGGLPRKVTVADLVGGVGVPVSTGASNILRGDGAGGWVEETDLTVDASGNLSTTGTASAAAGGTLPALGALNQADNYFAVNRDSVNSALYVLKDSVTAGPAARFGQGTMGTTTYTEYVELGGAGNHIDMVAPAPKLRWHETDAAANEGEWDIVTVGGILTYRSRGDGDTSGTEYLQIVRSGATVTDAQFNVPVKGTSGGIGGVANASFYSSDAGTVLSAGSYVTLSRLYSSARTALGNNVYADASDAVSGQMRHAVTHGSYGHTIYEIAGGQHWWYGNAGSTTAGTVVSKQQLMTLYEDGELEITHNGGATGPALTAINAGTTNLIASFEGDSDALEIATVSAGDYTIRNSGQNNYITFYDGTGGVDIGYNGQIKIECDSGNNVGLYAGATSVLEFQTQDSNAAGNSTGALVKHFNQSFYDVGMNQMPRIVTNASVTLTDNHAGGCYYHNNATTYTITLNNSGGGGADFPVEGCFFIVNFGSGGTSGNITVNTGTGTLYVPGIGSTTGSRTIGPGVATIWKYAADTWFLWGDNIS
jgi:hypothetical protein